MRLKRWLMENYENCDLEEIAEIINQEKGEKNA